jgi:hypothetical protein
MKKILLILLILQILVQTMSCAEKQPASPIWNGTADTAWYNDSQTEFTITTPEQLAGLAKLVEGGNNFYDKTIKLGADIMRNDTADWQNWASKPPKNKWKPIGIYIDGNVPFFLHSHIAYDLMDIFVPEFILRALTLRPTDLPFRGTFDGGGFAVSGVYINTSKNSQGLFGYIIMYNKKAELRNLGLHASYIKGGALVGGLAGNSYGIVNGCYSTALVTGITVVGGLVGRLGDNAYSDGTIINSYSVGVVLGDSIAGGLVGQSEGTISNSYSASKVLGKTMIDGLVGKNRLWSKGGSIVSSYYSIEASGQSKSNAYGKTDAEMKERETYEGWDFDETWRIDRLANNGYPYLQNISGKAE